MGAWTLYGLGSESDSLPAYVVMKSQFQSAGVGATQATWSAGFLPSNHQGVEFRSGNEPVRLMRELQQQWGMDKWVGHYLNMA